MHACHPLPPLRCDEILTSRLLDAWTWFEWMAVGMQEPGAYADVEFETGVERRLSIPSDAILKSKDGDFIVLAQSDGRFEPRKILTGLNY